MPAASSGARAWGTLWARAQGVRVGPVSLPALSTSPQQGRMLVAGHKSCSGHWSVQLRENIPPDLQMRLNFVS